MGPIGDLLNAIQRVASDISGFIAGKFRDLTELLGRILSGFQAAVGLLFSQITGIARGVLDLFDDRMKFLFNAITLSLGTIADFARTLPQRLGDFAQRVADSLGELPDDALKALGAWIGQNWPKLVEWVTTFFPDIAEALVGDRLRPAFLAIGDFVDRMRTGDISAAELRAVGSPQGLGRGFGELVWLFFSLVMSLPMVISAYGEPGVELVRQSAFEVHPTRLVGPETAAALALRGVLGPGEATTLAAKHGISQEQFTLLQETTRSLLAPGELLDLYNRNGRQRHNLDVALERLGYNEPDRAHLAQLADFIPPVSDVLTFLTRDNFNEEIVREFGQEAEFDVNYQLGKKLFEQLGMSTETALEYWKAHWQLPSLEFGYRMFQRTGGPDTGQPRTLPSGATVHSWISHDTLQRLHRAHGIEPFWREAFLNIAFNPLTRVDIRRLHRVGLLNKDGVAQAYMDAGYNDRNAALLADFVEKLNGADEQAQVHALRTPVANRVLNTYRKHYLTREQADAHLKDLGFTDAARAELLATADLDIAEAYATATEAAARAGYVSGVRGADGTSAILSQAGFGSETISRLLKVWDVARQNRELSAEEKQHRELTRGEIVEAYNDHIVTRDQAGAMLVHAGFDVSAAEQLLAIADVRVKRSELKDLEGGIHGRYVAGKLTAGQAVAELDALGVRPARRAALLATWDLEIARRESRIPVATVQAMVGQKIMTVEDARKELRASGLGDREIGWYFQLWGVGGAPAPRAGA